MYDLIFEGGIVVDGTGAARYRADVGVVGDQIASIGHLAGQEAVRRIDVTGKIVAPGFVDFHSHSEWTIMANLPASSSVRQGVTTEFLGNCGNSFAPTDRPATVRPLVPVYLRDLVEVGWRTFHEYLEEMERARPAINVAHMVGHHALRLTALGFDARPPSLQEQAAMEAALAQALDEGAAGLSFGLEYAPGLNSTFDEMVGLAKVVARRGGIVTVHMRNQDAGYLAAVNETLELARRTGVTLQLSHIPPHRGNPQDDWPRARDMVEKELHRGLSVAFDAHPYLWGGTLLTIVLPPWAFEGGVDAILARLRDPRVREEIKRYPGTMLKGVMNAGHWEDFVITYTKNSRDLIGKSIAEIAAERGMKDPFDLVFDILLTEGDALFGALWVTHIIDEEVQPEILRHPATIIMSDGMTLCTEGPLGQVGWHPRCFGWTARLLGEHVRDRRLLTLEQAVHKITQKPADRMGLIRRGAVKERYFADVVIFDECTIRDCATYQQPSQYPEGIDFVLVNGHVAVEHGRESGHRCGRVLRFQR